MQDSEEEFVRASDPESAVEEVLDALIGMYGDGYDRIDRAHEIKPILSRLLREARIVAGDALAASVRKHAEARASAEKERDRAWQVAIGEADATPETIGAALDVRLSRVIASTVHDVRERAVTDAVAKMVDQVAEITRQRDEARVTKDMWKERYQQSEERVSALAQKAQEMEKTLQYYAGNEVYGGVAREALAALRASSPQPPAGPAWACCEPGKEDPICKEIGHFGVPDTPCDESDYGSFEEEAIARQETWRKDRVAPPATPEK